MVTSALRRTLQSRQRERKGDHSETSRVSTEVLTAQPEGHLSLFLQKFFSSLQSFQKVLPCDEHSIDYTLFEALNHVLSLIAIHLFIMHIYGTRYFCRRLNNAEHILNSHLVLAESNFTSVCWLNFDHTEVAIKKHCGRQRNDILQFSNGFGAVGGEELQNVGHPPH